MYHYEAQDPLSRVAEATAPIWRAALTVVLSGHLSMANENPDVKLWTDDMQPTEKVGKTTYLWYFPPARGTQR
jgi:hypothetical protein